MFEFEDDVIAPAHHPFTSPTLDTIQYLDSDLSKVKARSYDLVLNGFELSSGSIRIHDSQLQNKMFQVLNLSQEEIDHKFGFFLKIGVSGELTYFGKSSFFVNFLAEKPTICPFIS